MGRLTSAGNNRGLLPTPRQRRQDPLASLAQTLTVGALAFLAHKVAAVPLVPLEPPQQAGCCVSYGLSYEHTECCHAFALMSDPDAECTAPAGFVGGGMRYHHGLSCEDAQGLAMYQPAAAPPAEAVDEQTQTMLVVDPVAAETSHGGLIGGTAASLGPAWTQDEATEPPAGEQDMGGWVASVYTDEQQAQLNVDLWGDIPDVEPDAEPVTMVLDAGALAAADARAQAAGESGAGCCVAYGLVSRGAECCHEFTTSTVPEDCALPAGWVGGGRRYHASTCTETKQLAQYSLAAEPCEAPAGEQDMGGWVATVYTDEQQVRLGVDLWGEPVDELVVGGGQKIVAPGQADADAVPAPVATDDGDDGDAVVVGMLGGDESLGPAWTQDDTIEQPASERDMGEPCHSIPATSMVIVSEPCGSTTEQQVRLGVDETGAPLPDDEDHTVADEDTATGYDDGAAADGTLTTEQQAAADAITAAGFPGILPVVIDAPPEPLVEDDAPAPFPEIPVPLGPCYSNPATSMVIVAWNPQCDEHGQFLAKQCGRSADDCWCVDEDGETLGRTFFSWGFTEDACQTARLSVESHVDQDDVPEVSATAPVVMTDNIPEIADAAPVMVTEATQTSFTTPKAIPETADGATPDTTPPVADATPASVAPVAPVVVVNDEVTPASLAAPAPSPTEDAAPATTPSASSAAPTAPAQPSIVSSVAQQAGISDLSPKNQVFAVIGGGVVGLVLISAMVMMGAHRCRGHNSRISMYAGFSDDQNGHGSCATGGVVALPKWSKSWVVSGVGLGDSLSSPMEPAVSPPGMGMDRVSTVGMPRPGSQQFTIGTQGGVF